jgi:hypothetical protein
MTVQADRSRRSPGRMLKSPLAAPGSSAPASPGAFESLALASGRTALTDREATLAEFQHRPRQRRRTAPPRQHTREAAATADEGMDPPVACPGDRCSGRDARGGPGVDGLTMRPHQGISVLIGCDRRDTDHSPCSRPPDDPLAAITGHHQ